MIRQSDGEPSNSYTEQWQEYRRRRRWAWGLGVAPLPVLWLLFALQGQLPWLASLTTVLSLAWLAGAIVSGWRFGLWPCPRCGRPFGLRHLYYFLLAPRCVHCGLPKWAQRDPNVPPNSSLPGGPDGYRAYASIDKSIDRQKQYCLSMIV